MSAAETPAGKIRVGIVDDHAITRRALSEFLSDEDSIVVVGQASSGGEAMEMTRKIPMDVLLLDIEMPGQSGIDAIAHIVSRDNAPAVLMLSAHPPAAYSVAMIRKGASGYLNKQCEPSEIIKAIQTLATGNRYLDEEVSSLLVDSASQHRSIELHTKLTGREFQIFLRLAQGQDSHQAARELSLSVKTVLSYRVKIMDKMQARTNSELTYYALKHRLID